MLKQHASAPFIKRRGAPSSCCTSPILKNSRPGASILPQLCQSLQRNSLTTASFLFAILLIVFSGPRLSAQTAGSISGHVADPTTAVIPGATITLSNTATGATRTTVSTGAGDYTFPDVPPGTYNLQASHTGFKSATAKSITVQVQQSLRQDFTLQIGEVSQTVTVSATGALLQVENSTLGTVVEQHAVTQLPLNGRNYLGLVGLSANTNTDSPSAGQASARLGGQRASESISAAGQRIMFDHFTLDGAQNTDPDFNTYVVQPSIDAIQEFKVQTGVYPAEFGYNATQINVVTKSGTNQYHGSLFEFIRNDVADALPYRFSSTQQRAPFKWNDFGYELAGPVSIPHVFNGKNKLFFMANNEWFDQRQSQQATIAAPTQAMLNGDFSNLRDNNGNPVTLYEPGSGVNGQGKTQLSCNGVLNVICPNRISPYSKNILKYYAAANQPVGTGKNPYANDYTYTSLSPQDHYIFTLRADYDQSAASQWTFRYSSGNEDQETTYVGGAGNKITSNETQYLGSNTWTISPNLVNEARFGYTSFNNALGTLSANSIDEVAAIGIPNLSPGAPSTWGIPSLGFADAFSGIGDTNDGPYVVNDPQWEISDNLSWVKGKHTFDFGFEFNRQHFNQLGNQFSRGVFTFQPNATANYTTDPATGKLTAQGGDGFAEFLLGDIYQSTVAVQIANAKYLRNAQAYYVDDTYKVTPKVTVAMGLRYELTPPWDDLLGNEFNIAIPQRYAGPNQPLSNYPYFVRQGTCSNVYQGLNIRWVDASGNPTTPAPTCSNGKFPHALLNTAYNNFAPRFSVSYSPTATTVVRTGYGIFYNHDIGNMYFDMARNLAARVTFFNGNNGGGQGVPDLFWNNAVPPSGGAIASVPPPYGLAMAMSHKTSYTQEYLLNVQQQMGPNWVFEFGYLGGTSRHLYGFRNANQVIPYGYIGNGTPTPIASRKPYQNFSVIQLVHDAGVANYNALSFKATRRYNNGFNLIAAYTYSKSLDDTSGVRTQQSPLFPQNSDCLPCEYGPSDFDVTHRVVTSVLYDLPVGQGKLWAPKGVLGSVVGGWQIGTLATWQTGTPATPTDGGRDIADTGNSYDRPNVTGVDPNRSNRTYKDWWNAAAFAPATAGYFGDARRNMLRGPGFLNFDSYIHKDFHMFYNDQHVLQIRLESFNTFNHANFGLPSTNIFGSFGSINSTANNMRQLQLAAKYTF